MLRLFRKTSFYKQLVQIKETTQSIRRSQYRLLLRLKRASVRCHIFFELSNGQLESMQNMRVFAVKKAEVNVLQATLKVHEQREKQMLDLLAKHGQKMPMPRAKPSRGISEAIDRNIQDLKTHDTPEEALFKKNIIQSVEGLIPKGGTSAATGHVASALLRESVECVSLDSTHGRAGMTIALVVGMAKELNLPRKKLENLIAGIERESGDKGLRTSVMEALDHANDANIAKSNPRQEVTSKVLNGARAST